MAQLLYTTSYKKPGVYIGQIIEPSADSIGLAARIPVMIGKGSRYAQATNSAVVRAYVYEEELDISASSPYTAVLKHPALSDQSRAELVRKSDGYVIPEVKWYFGEDNQSVVISEDVYVADDEYTLSYQSTDRTVLDPTPVLDIISVGSCGSSLSTNNFVENRDYFIAMSLENLVDGTGNETDKLAFDARYESSSLYPVAKVTDVDWLSVDCSSYSGVDASNLEVVLTASVVMDGEDAISSITLKNEEKGIEVNVTEEGKFFALSSDNTSILSKIKVAISSFTEVVNESTAKVSVTAGKIFPMAKDNRKVTLKVTAKSEGTYTIYYASNTPEGGFGTVESVGDKIILPGNIILNIEDSLEIGDSFSFELLNHNVIDWNLTAKVSSYFRVDSVYRDVNGSKTGVNGAYYVILNGIPLDTPTTDSDVTIQWVEGTSFVIVSTADGAKPQNFSISYEYAGNEPNPGDVYYLTTKHIRPDNMFNKVIFVSSRAEGQALLAPSTAKNDLYIANEIAWDEIGNRAGYQIAYIQIKDSDEDGVLSSADVQAAIDALATSKKVTDYCLLGNFEYLNKLLAANELGNDPFECRENEVWVGCPTGTIVGDINTEGSLVNVAQAALKVYGTENPAHGTRVLVAPTEATKKITLEGGIEQLLKLDGSFVAWALACHRSRMKASQSIMRETITSFATMQTYDDINDITLGQNQIVYFSKASTGIYVVEEDFTTDKFAFEFSLEQITSQRLQVVRDLRAFMNESLIGYTPDTPASGINTITSFLIRGLKAKIKEGTIAPYQNPDGSKREIDPAKDIFVTYVKDNPTQYQFGYGFYTQKVMKQLFGSYVVDKDFADTGLGV